MKHYALMLIILFFASCDRPECETKNEILKMHQPDDVAYKQELARVINANSIDAYSYWVSKYKKTDGLESLYVNIQNENLCAIVV